MIKPFCACPLNAYNLRSLSHSSNSSRILRILPPTFFILFYFYSHFFTHIIIIQIIIFFLQTNIKGDIPYLVQNFLISNSLCTTHCRERRTRVEKRVFCIFIHFLFFSLSLSSPISCIFRERKQWRGDGSREKQLKGSFLSFPFLFVSPRFLVIYLLPEFLLFLRVHF